MSENKVSLGQAIFTGIEKNEYLKEIYDSLLNNYFFKVFRIENPSHKTVDIDDTLRFADLLSKSAGTEFSEQHHSLAQELIILLDATTPDNEQIRYVMGSVLSNTSNYLGISHSVPGFIESNLFDRLSTEISKDYLRIPSEENHYFLRSQKDAFEHMTRDAFFSYSGPTSMGKSFVMRTFIRERIKKNADCNFAIIVPTKALINEVSKELADKLGGTLKKYDYRIVISAGATILQDKNAHHYIFVMTPERLMYQLIGFPDILIHYLFIDEAQNISEKNGRSAFYYQIVGMLNRGEHRPNVVFASPNIPNPDVYLELIPNSVEGKRGCMASSFTPVSQEKFLIDLQSSHLGYYNSLTQSIQIVESIENNRTFSSFVKELGAGKKNLVYCNAKVKVVDFAREYANGIHGQEDPELRTLAEEIRDQIHEDYYLAKTVEKGVAYHIGYLPTNIRLRIEELFRKKDGGIHTIFCTSTLLEGVNLPADNLFITDYKNGLSPMSSVEFRNLIGRVGRLNYTLYGNVFLMCLPGGRVFPNNYVSLLKKEVEPQKLSITTISDREKEYVVDCLKKGQTKLKKIDKQTNEEYSLMRKIANILLRDIMLGRRGRVIREFETVLTSNDISIIREFFTHHKNEPDDDINVNVDQVSRLVNAIAAGLDYPKVNLLSGYVDFQDTLNFLEKLCDVLDWETYETSTLGQVKNSKHTKLRYYATLLTQWLRGKGLKYLIEQAILFKVGKNISINRKSIPFDNSPEHHNKVIEDTLNDVNTIILFRLSNYFMRLSTELKKYHHREFLPNDWYEYVEYGTTNKICILLQKNGFSSEVATYIQKHEDTYISHTENGIKINISILDCSSISVRNEAQSVWNNIPELFVVN